MTRLSTFLVLTLPLFIACGSGNSTDNNHPDSTQSDATVQGQTYEMEEVPEDGLHIKGLRDTPEEVVQLLFTAARTNQSQLLQGLCPPSKTNDGDTDCICALHEDYAPHKCGEESKSSFDWNGYQDNFMAGGVKGAARIEGNRAEVDFNFGNGGAKSETMKLVREEDVWYLESF